MPAQSGDNSDPSLWHHPPVPESWWNIIRENMPVFNPQTTMTRGLGRIAEHFRTLPSVIRSNHPQCSFSGWGKYAKEILHEHVLNEPFGEKSPLGKLYSLKAKILLMGVNHEVNTSLHYAEFKTDYPLKKYIIQSAAVLEDGRDKWVSWKEIDYKSDDFAQIGADYEQFIDYQPITAGNAEIRIHSMQKMVDFAGNWMKIHRIIHS
jgi:aminoglycoside 3-N-acetyltransferase